jgi:hypothetical protein
MKKWMIALTLIACLWAATPAPAQDDCAKLADYKAFLTESQLLIEVSDDYRIWKVSRYTWDRMPDKNKNKVVFLAAKHRRMCLDKPQVEFLDEKTGDPLAEWTEGGIKTYSPDR